jgi:hypothetical protein
MRLETKAIDTLKHGYKAVRYKIKTQKAMLGAINKILINTLRSNVR